MRVRVSAGELIGATDDELMRFRGVPYAAAPVGDLRFAAPVPHPGWRGPREAIAFGATPVMPPASETSSIPELPVPGDEILNLNITAPSTPPADRGEPGGYPVYIWIHGGGYVAGSPGGGWFDGAAYARTGIVVVSITYRLGFDGFGLIEHAPANRGVLDCLAALTWVREEIATFGGDPQRITIGGQSAGGGLVLSLLTTPGIEDRVSGAVIHSAPLPDLTLDDAAKVTQLMRGALGVDDDPAAWRMLSREAITLAERDLETRTVWSDLTDLRRALTHVGPLTRLGPVLGVDPLPEDPLAALARASDLPLLIGTTQSEWNAATALLEPVITRLSPVTLLGALGLPAALARAYPRAHADLTPAALIGQALTDRAFRLPALAVAQAREAAGHPAQLWDFRWHPDGGVARHCIDLPFAWSALDGDRVDRIAGTDPPAGLAAEMTGDIARFIHGGTAGWPGFTSGAPIAKVYDDVSWVGRDPYRFERIALSLVDDPP